MSLQVTIETARTVQDLARIVEVHVKASQEIKCRVSNVALMSSSNVALASSSRKANPGDQLKVPRLARLCSRLAALLQAGDHPGLEGYQAASLAQKLLSQVAVDLSVFPSPPLQLSDIEHFLDAWAKLGYNPVQSVRADMLYQLSSEGGNLLSTANSKTLSSLAWSLQKLGWADQQLMRQMLDLAGQRAPGFDPDTLNLFAKMLRTNGAGDKQSGLLLGSLSRPLLPRLTPSELAMLLVTLVQANAQSSVLFSSAAQHILPHINTCMPRDLAWLATAYAQAGYVHLKLFQKIAKKAAQHAEYMDRKELAWLVRAFTMSRVYDAELFTKLAGTTQHYLQVVLPRELKEQRMQYLAKQATLSTTRPKRVTTDMYGNEESNTGPVQDTPSDPINVPSQLYVDLADLAWGFARSGHYERPLFDAMAAAATAHMYSFDAQKLGQLCWAFKRVQHHDQELMAAAAGHALSLATELVQKQETLPSWTSWEQQVGYKTAGCSWLPFFPGPGSLGRPTGSLDIPPCSLADSWGLVSVLSCLGNFSEDCSSLLQTLHPLLAHVVQPRQQHAAYGHIEELVLLLEPLVQQVQLQPRGWDRHFAELTLQVMMAISKFAKSAADLRSNCKILVQSYIAMSDAGWGQELTTSVGGGQMKEILLAWKDDLKQPPAAEPAAWQSRLIELLVPMGATNMQRSARTPDGLFSCLLLATVRGRRVAIDFCAGNMYASNAPSPEATAGQRGSSARAAGGKEVWGKEVWGSRGQDGPAPHPFPIILFPQHSLTRSIPKLPSSSSTQPLFSLSFRARGLRHRGWVPVLLPAREWIQVVGSAAAASKYLEVMISAALNRGAVRERD